MKFKTAGWRCYMSIAFILCLSPSFVYSQYVFPSLDSLWAYADRRNITILSSRTEIAVNGEALKQTKARLQPTLTLNGNFTDNIKIQPTLIPANLFDKSAPEGTFIEEEFGKRYNYNTSIVAQLNLVNTQDWFAIRTAKYNKEIAGLNLSKTRKEVYEQVARTYYTYLLLKEAAKLSEDNCLAADAIFGSAEKQFAEGQISGMTLNNAAINKEKAGKALQAALQNSASALNELKMLLGFSVHDTMSLTESFNSAVPLAGQPSFGTDPEIEIARGRMLLAETSLKAAKASYAPSLSLIYQWNTQVTGNDFLDFDGSNTLPQQYYGLRLSFPILAGGTRRYQVKKSNIDLQYSRLYYEDISKRIALQDETLVREYQSAWQLYRKSADIMALYHKNDTHAALQLEEGLISLDRRMDVYAGYINNQHDYLESLSDYMIQYYRLQIRKKAL
ncbi:TolC family protein [Arcticibacter tournemirensis]|uniref:TolC family protein n=2 Tax=Pseudomonadati TaxID=3379134 RepID=A0A4Q0M5B0_9SPHI|nr:TolC family protein [Arcticibacter tournemirensis]RXF68198.1 TolC family protein [Arcticibacter tournemirensis]